GFRVWIRAPVGDPGYLAALVHKGCDGVRASQRAQVLHLSVLPQKRADLRSDRAREWIRDRIEGAADDLVLRVDVARHAGKASERSEVDDLAILPESRNALWPEYGIDE